MAILPGPGGHPVGFFGQKTLKATKTIKKKVPRINNIFFQEYKFYFNENKIICLDAML